MFDFGGGTCDVAVLAVQPLGQDRVAVSPRAVSRYHRLGGGDLDAAILYEVLLPQLLDQNPIPGFSPGFTEKKKVIEPAYLGIAEALKIGLSIQIRRLRSFGKYDNADKSQIVKVVSGRVPPCKVGEHRLVLQSPSLSAAQFEALLQPFLDRDSLTAVDTDYRMTASVFAPLDDALSRAELNRGDIDFCLLVGGMYADTPGRRFRTGLLLQRQTVNLRGLRLGSDGGRQGGGLPCSVACVVRHWPDSACLPRRHFHQDEVWPGHARAERDAAPVPCGERLPAKLQHCCSRLGSCWKL